MRAHGLGGRGERLDGLHHGLGGHDWYPWVVEGDREGHLHDSMRDGDNGPSMVHDSGHLCCGGCNVHVQAVLLGAGRGREGEEEGEEKSVNNRGMRYQAPVASHRCWHSSHFRWHALCGFSLLRKLLIRRVACNVSVVARLHLSAGKRARAPSHIPPAAKTPSLSLFLTLNVSSSEESPL